MTGWPICVHAALIRIREALFTADSSLWNSAGTADAAVPSSFRRNADAQFADLVG